MAIFYQAKQVKNPKDSSATPLYYARIKSVGVVDESELVNRISARSGVSEGIVASVLRDSMNEVVDLVTLGYRVQLPALGQIYTTLSSNGENTAKEVKPDSVKRIYIRLFPSVSFKTKVATKSKLANFDALTDENESTGNDTTGGDTGNDGGGGGGTGSNPL
ncbi:MAG: hypothetical protein IKK62_12230 [Bacteroidaceae bacterium]|nr:hypothetical protein [Bacteroidaceae bacterium]